MSFCYTITICRYSDPDSFHRSEALSGDISIARRMRACLKVMIKIDVSLTDMGASLYKFIEMCFVLF